MLLDSATVEANFERFLKRTVENEAVFYLANQDGVANSVSNEDEKTVVLMFWSDQAYAARANNTLEEEFNVVEMELFDFLYRWLPGMSGDGVLVGTNWTGDLVGREADPFALRELIEDKMSAEMLETYEQKYEQLAEIT